MFSVGRCVMSRTGHLFFCAILLLVRPGTFIIHHLGAEENLRPLFVCMFRCSDSSRPETVRPCLLPCKRDCIVTPFSEWTTCPSTCLPGSSLTGFSRNLFCNCLCNSLTVFLKLISIQSKIF